MFQTSTSDREMIQKEIFWQELLIGLGFAQRTIFLNGGSDTRRDVRENYEQCCQVAGVPYMSSGFSIIIGGFVPWRQGGWRYVVGRRQGEWLHWRKAKRVVRNGKKTVDIRRLRAVATHAPRVAGT
jgi:hypothetical protein